MSEYTITIPMDGYLQDYCKKSFGYPAEFPKDSPETRLIKRFLKQPPGDFIYEKEKGLPVVIPFFKERDPRVYNYLGPKAKKAISSSIASLFRAELTQFFIKLENCRCSDKDLIYAFMEEKEIEEKHWDTVSKIWYRTRASLRKKNNIDL